MQGWWWRRIRLHVRQRFPDDVNGSIQRRDGNVLRFHSTLDLCGIDQRSRHGDPIRELIGALGDNLLQDVDSLQKCLDSHFVMTSAALGCCQRTERTAKSICVTGNVGRFVTKLSSDLDRAGQSLLFVFNLLDSFKSR